MKCLDFKNFIKPSFRQASSSEQAKTGFNLNSNYHAFIKYVYFKIIPYQQEL